jgi:hypothetical protein
MSLRFSLRSMGRVTVLWIAPVLNAWAHPGIHGDDVLAAFWHLLTEPDHWAGLVLVALAVVLVARHRRSGSAGPMRTNSDR